jgi:hypothetical protein
MRLNPIGAVVDTLISVAQVLWTDDMNPLGQKIEAVEGIVSVRRSPVGQCAAIGMMQQRIASPFLFLAVAITLAKTGAA